MQGGGAQGNGTSSGMQGSETQLGNAPIAGNAPNGSGMSSGGSGGASGNAADMNVGGAPSAPPMASTGAAGSGMQSPAAPPVMQPPSVPSDPGCLLCDDFEGAATGGSPDPDKWSLTLDFNSVPQAAPNIAIDGTVAHSGSRSVRVMGTGSLREIVGHVARDQFFARAWLRLSTVPTGGGPVVMAIGGDQNADLRLRLWAGQLATLNTGAGDSIVPNAATSGNCTQCVPVPSNAWFCAEMSVDNASQSVILWINGNEAARVTNNDWNSSWPRFPSPTNVRFGYWGLQGAGPTQIWIDDVAVRSTRVGCQ